MAARRDGMIRKKKLLLQKVVVVAEGEVNTMLRVLEGAEA